MEVINFGPHVVKTSLKDSEFGIIKSLINEATNPINDTLAGQIKYENQFSPAAATAIYEIMLHKFVDYLDIWAEKVYDQKLRYSLKLDNLWLNKMVAGEYNPLHNHSADISFVYYIDVPEEIHEEENNTTAMDMGAIEFIYGKGSGYEPNHFLDPITNYIQVPQANELFIFPSFLYHHVQQFKSDVERISIAGNLLMKIEGN